jgi:hypothetical protein
MLETGRLATTRSLRKALQAGGLAADGICGHRAVAETESQNDAAPARGRACVRTAIKSCCWKIFARRHAPAVQQGARTDN